MIVRIDIPTGSGMYQLNQQFAPILVTGNTTFTMPIDTSGFDVFTNASTTQSTLAVPFAETAFQLNAAVQNLQPGGMI